MRPLTSGLCTASIVVFAPLDAIDIPRVLQHFFLWHDHFIRLPPLLRISKDSASPDAQYLPFTSSLKASIFLAEITRSDAAVDLVMRELASFVSIDKRS